MTTHFEKIQALGQRMATNLTTMGVESTWDEGGLTLADKILQIQNGILIDSNLTIIPSSYAIEKGSTVTLTGLLGATYDSTGDLVGYITGASVKIYDNNTLVDTVTTDNTGAYSKTLTLSSSGNHVLKAVYDGEANVYDNCESSTVTVYATLDTTLSISVPALVYSDAFSVTGVLTDEEDNPVSGASVKLYRDGTILEATATTDSNGEVTFSKDAPTTITDYTFRLVYEGDATYTHSSSSTVTRTVGKETSVLNVTSPVNNDSLYSDGSLSVAGTLYSDDAETISGASILVQQDGTTITTLTTDNTGAFTGTLNGSDLSSGDLDFIYETTTYYTASSSTKTIVVNTPTLELESDVNIASVGDTVNLTATYTGATLSNKSIDFIRVIADYTEDDTGTDLSVDLCDEYVLESDGVVTLGDSTDYIVVDFENQEYKIYESGTQTDTDTFSNVNSISLSNDTLTIGTITIDATDYSSIDFTTLYAYSETSTGSLYIYEPIGTGTTDNAGTCSVSYLLKDTGQLYIQCHTSEITSNNININSIWYYDADGTKMLGTFTTDSDGTYDYITDFTGISPDCELPDGDFKISYKFYSPSSYTNTTNVLWAIGASNTNCNLIGTEMNDKRLRVYTSVNGTNTIRQTFNNAWSNNNWYDVIITYQNNVVSMALNGNTVSYALSSANIFNLYNPGMISNARLTDFRIEEM